MQHPQTGSVHRFTDGASCPWTIEQQREFAAAQAADSALHLFRKYAEQFGQPLIGKEFFGCFVLENGVHPLELSFLPADARPLSLWTLPPDGRHCVQPETITPPTAQPSPHQSEFGFGCFRD